MIASCPSCGARRRFRLLAEDATTCVSCGFEAPEGMRAATDAARRALGHLDPRARQFRGLAAVVVTRSPRWSLALHGVVAVLLVLVSAANVHSCTPHLSRASASTATAWTLPAIDALLVAIAAIVVGRRFTVGVRRLRKAAASLGPDSSGAWGCRVCGGALALTPGRMRCAACHADNLPVAREGEEAEVDPRELAPHVRREAEALGGSQSFGLPLLAALGLFVFPLTLLLVGGRVMAAVDVALPSGMRMHLVEYEGSLGAAHRFCLEREVDALCQRPDVHACLDNGEVAPQVLVGRSSPYGRVEKVARNVFFGDVAVVVDVDQGRRLVALEELCVDGDPTEAWLARERR